jgi:hypothetical protein
VLVVSHGIESEQKGSTVDFLVEAAGSCLHPRLDDGPIGDMVGDPFGTRNNDVNTFSADTADLVGLQRYTGHFRNCRLANHQPESCSVFSGVIEISEFRNVAQQAPAHLPSACPTALTSKPMSSSARIAAVAKQAHWGSPSSYRRL